MSADPAYITEALRCLDPEAPDDPAHESAAARYSDLLVRIRADDADAFKELILSLARPLELYAHRFSTSIDTAKDVVQDVFAQVWGQRHALQVRGNFRTYLYTAVRNRALDVRKHDHAEITRIAGIQADGHVPGMGNGSTRADAAVERGEIAARVAAALAALPPRAREVALLRWQDGLSHAEIAAVMGITLSTVKNHLTLASQMTRALLEDLRDSA